VAVGGGSREDVDAARVEFVAMAPADRDAREDGGSVVEIDGALVLVAAGVEDYVVPVAREAADRHRLGDVQRRRQRVDAVGDDDLGARRGRVDGFLDTRRGGLPRDVGIARGGTSLDDVVRGGVHRKVERVARPRCGCRPRRVGRPQGHGNGSVGGEMRGDGGEARAGLVRDAVAVEVPAVEDRGGVTGAACR